MAAAGTPITCVRPTAHYCSTADLYIAISNRSFPNTVFPKTSPPFCSPTSTPTTCAAWAGRPRRCACPSMPRKRFTRQCSKENTLRAPCPKPCAASSKWANQSASPLSPSRLSRCRMTAQTTWATLSTAATARACCCSPTWASSSPKWRHSCHKPRTSLSKQTTTPICCARANTRHA